jgi:hypothetical protein
MNDITQSYRFQQVLLEAASYRTLRSLYQADPKIGPGTVDLFQRLFRSDRDDAGEFRAIATGRNVPR